MTCFLIYDSNANICRFEVAISEGVDRYNMIMVSPTRRTDNLTWYYLSKGPLLSSSAAEYPSHLS